MVRAAALIAALALASCGRTEEAKASDVYFFLMGQGADRSELCAAAQAGVRIATAKQDALMYGRWKDRARRSCEGK